MKPEYKMLLWEQWRQTRAYLILPVFVVMIHVGMAIMVRLSEMNVSDVIYLTDMYVLGALLVAGVVFCLHFDRRLTLRLGVPERTFRLPVSSSVLILCQLGYRMAVVLAIFLASLLLHRVANGPETLLQVPGTLAFLAGFYAIALAVTSLVQPYSFGAKAKFLTPFFLFALAVAVPAWSAAASAPPLFAALSVGAGLGTAIWAHGKARHGGLEWRGPALALGSKASYQSTSEIPRFTSPLDAQRWLERRRFGWMLPAAGTLVGLSLAVYALFWGGRGMYWAPWQTPYEAPPLLLAVVFPAALVGFLLVYLDYKAPETPLGRYMFTRPLSAELMASARLRMAARSLTGATLIAFFILSLSWMLLTTYMPWLHPYYEVNDLLPTGIRLMLDWVLFGSLAFGIFFLVSRSLVLALGTGGMLFVGYWLFENTAPGQGIWGQLMLAEVASLIALAVVVAVAWRQGIRRAGYLYAVAGGLALWIGVLLLRDLAWREEVQWHWYGDQGFRGLDPYPVITGVWGLVALCAVPLAFHRRRSQSLWSAPLNRDRSPLRQERRRAFLATIGVFLIVGLMCFYHWRMRDLGERHLVERRNDVVQGIARLEGIQLPPLQDIWTLQPGDWEALYGARENLYFELSSLERLVSPRHAPTDLPEPGDPLSLFMEEELDKTLKEWEELGAGALALGTFVEEAWAPLRRHELGFNEVAEAQSLATYNILVQLACIRIWRLADEGETEEAWKQFEKLTRNVQEVYGQERSLESASAYAGYEAPTRLFMHLHQKDVAPRGLWRRMLAQLPERYDAKAATSSAVATYIANASILDGSEALWQLIRRSEYRLAGGSSNLREQWINYGLYKLSGMSRVDRYNYLRSYYDSLIWPHGQDNLFRFQRNRQLDEASSALHILMNDAFSQYMRSMSLQLRQQLFRCAVAVLAYHSEHGKLPERLSELIPEYLEELPVDLLVRDTWELSHAEVAHYREESQTSRPIWSFHYRKLDARSAIVYSVGHNGLDDFERPHDYRNRHDDIAIRLGPLPDPTEGGDAILHR